MNPELIYRMLAEDPNAYRGMSVEEVAYCTITNHYDQKQAYKMDIIKEEGSEDRITPVAIFLHGGGFTEPCDKRQAYVPLFARSLTKAGYTVVAPDYPVYKDEQDRDANGGGNQAVLKAAQAIGYAYDYLEEHAARYHLDMSQVSIMGGSAGGMTAFYAVANQPDRYRAMVNCWGSPHKLPNLENFPPVLSIHGTKDQAVPYELEANLARALDAAGIRNELITLEGGPHTPLDRFDEYMPRILEWIADEA